MPPKFNMNNSSKNLIKVNNSLKKGGAVSTNKAFKPLHNNTSTEVVDHCVQCGASNIPKSDWARHVKHGRFDIPMCVSKQTAPRREKTGGRRRRNRLNQLGRRLEENDGDVFPSVPKPATSGSLDGEQSHPLNTAGRPRTVWVAPCPSIGQAHYFGDGLYCTKCSEYKDCDDSDDASTIYDGKALVFESSGQHTHDLETANPQIVPRGGSVQRPAVSDTLEWAERGSMEHHAHLPVLRGDIQLANSTASYSGDASSLKESLARTEPLSRRALRTARVARHSARVLLNACCDSIQLKADQAYVGACKLKGAAVRDSRRRRRERQPLTNNHTLDLSAKTSQAITDVFESPHYDLAPILVDSSLSDDSRSFNESRRWYTSTLERLGYQRDSFTYGEIGSKIRGLTKKDAIINTSEATLKKDLNFGLYVYLLSEKMPISEYTKMGRFDANLATLHMQKLTKQYYAKSKTALGTLADVQKDVYTQSLAVDENSKEFLWGRNNVDAPKYTGFLEACRVGSQHKTTGLKILTAVAASYALVKLTPSVATAAELSLSHLGKTSLLATLSNASIASLTNFSQSLNLLSRVGQRLM